MIAIASIALAVFLDPFAAFISLCLAAFVQPAFRPLFAFPILLCASICFSVVHTSYMDNHLTIPYSDVTKTYITPEELLFALKRDGLWDDREYFIAANSWVDYENMKAALVRRQGNCSIIASVYAGPYLPSVGERSHLKIERDLAICNEVGYIGGSIGFALQMLVVWLASWSIRNRRSGSV